jgi:Flp pilus assembly pilin Flp
LVPWRTLAIASTFFREASMIWLQTLRVRDEGQDLLEYAMLASLIALVALATVTVLANQITDVFWGAIAAMDF